MTISVLTPLDKYPFPVSYCPPILFLAGPIQQAPKWQNEVIESFKEDYNKNLIICNPRRNEEVKLTEEEYYNQVNWEHTWLNNAEIILFWFPKKIEINPEREYAQTSRFELGEMSDRLKRDSRLNLVVGVEPGFSGERYIRYTFLKKHSIIVNSTLIDTCNQVKHLLYTKSSNG